MATTKRNLSIMRKLSDVTLTYLAIMQARIATQAPTGCQNDRAVRANILYYHQLPLLDLNDHPEA